MKTKFPSFDELDADQLKELIQSGKTGSDKAGGKKSRKKSEKLPLQEEKQKSQPDGEKLEAFMFVKLKG